MICTKALLASILLTALPSHTAPPSPLQVQQFVKQLDMAYLYQSPNPPKGCLTWKATSTEEGLRMTAQLDASPQCAQIQIPETWLVPLGGGEPFLLSEADTSRTPLSRIPRVTPAPQDPPNPIDAILAGEPKSEDDDPDLEVDLGNRPSRPRVVTARTSRQAGADLADRWMPHAWWVANPSKMPAPFGKSSGRPTAIRLDSTGLTIDGHHVSPLQITRRDSLGTFPDSVWTNSALKPIVATMAGYPNRPRNVVVSTGRNTRFTTIKPVFFSLAKSGIQTIALGCDGYSPIRVELYNRFSESTLEESSHSVNPEGDDLLLKYSTRNLKIYSGLTARRPRLEFALKTTGGSHRLSAQEVQTLGQAIKRLAAEHRHNWLGVAPDRNSRLEKLVQILHAVSDPSGGTRNRDGGKFQIALFGISR